MPAQGTIRTGIGGWTFEPWEGTFYPGDLPKKRQLEFASRQLATIEVNGTYYRSQTPETFAKWASEAPDGFVFSLKAPRFSTNRKLLGEGADSVERFVASGIAELGEKLGPILWQFMPTKRFDPDDFGAFLALLPAKAGGIALRHAVEVRHESFLDPSFVALAREHRVAIVHAEHETYPEISDVTADFVYSRLQRGRDEEPEAYAPEVLDTWAQRFRTWAAGGRPDDLPLVAPDEPAPKSPRDVFAYVIHEGKLRAPQGAMGLAKRLAAAE
ncbi:MULTISPECIES: DUF72 domain-containing protein [unclassified Aureimonas]|uniref:DUF72 domain-containing protein n=1 Tax=unclassified Aureimonas TaxID=2615206 RepID=UPI0006F95689|nr:MULTISPECIES: DUF72 domain-containing protein [unclassified Aureimonas]KQT60610.1 hypothetical protein ASG62_06975 [Aureimonas sp. Leaf427]KQT79482.1 hypothetical protein ASG54_09575 [Aureimonas sp. Leaf460]